MHCSYCRVQQDAVYISEYNLKRSVDLLLTSQQQELKFEFFGGEPLLLPFDLIKNTILYGERKAREKGKKINFLITTNGILLDKQKVKFLKEHNVLLILSLDGNRRSQNINRPQKDKKDSYSLIVKNVPLILKNHLNCYCYTVVTPETVKYLKSNFISLVNLGFKKIWIMLACCVKWEKDTIPILEKNLNWIAKTYPDLLQEKGIVLLNLKNWVAPVPFNTELSVNIDGYIYSACLTYLIHDEEIRKKFIITHIDNPDESIDKLDKKRLSNEEAMEVIFRENDISSILPNNIRFGRIFSKFRNDLCKQLKDNNLWHLYELHEKN